jgi:hypothetical protein
VLLAWFSILGLLLMTSKKSVVSEDPARPVVYQLRDAPVSADNFPQDTYIDDDVLDHASVSSGSRASSSLHRGTRSAASW